MSASEPYQRVVLIHYHEIGLKGHNRAKFEQRLLKNVLGLTAAHPVATVHKISGRLVAFLKEGTAREEGQACASFIARIPGVARVSCGFKCPREVDDINRAAVEALSEAEPFETFKVAARRAHTDFPIDSMTMNREVGAVLCAAYPEKRVQMKEMDVEVRVEVVQNSAFVYAFSIPGVGGLPVGSSGKLMCLLSSGIDSPVALWQMAKRGAVCNAVHFSGAPETSSASEFLVEDIARVLEQTGCIARVFTVELGSHQRAISLECPPPLRVILYRRLMFKVAERLARDCGAKALVTGESLGQVASQTLDNLCCTDASVQMPIFRPLIGTDKQDIISTAREIGTYRISTEDAPDCCTLFMPRSPETHAKLSAVEAAEAAFPEDEWVEELAEAARCQIFKQPK